MLRIAWHVPFLVFFRNTDFSPFMQLSIQAKACVAGVFLRNTDFSPYWGFFLQAKVCVTL